jgi:hypothetical protein
MYLGDASGSEKEFAISLDMDFGLKRFMHIHSAWALRVLRTSFRDWVFG